MEVVCRSTLAHCIAACRRLPAAAFLALLPLAAFAATGDSSYRVGPGDELAIEVYEDDSIEGSWTISNDGTVSLPLAGPIEVAGGTVDEVAQTVRRVLEESYLQRATVTVSVTQYRSQPIRVLGAVVEPGTHFLTSRWTLFDALTAAGGLTEQHDGRIEITRTSIDGRLSESLTIPTDRIAGGSTSAENLIVRAGDVIVAPIAADITVYFLGEVATQGPLTLSARGGGATLLTAIAKAGGLTDRASPRITIRRERGDGSRDEIAANFRRILAGDDLDIPLVDGDLVVVKESFL